jgi:hypothetical protein
MSDMTDPDPDWTPSTRVPRVKLLTAIRAGAAAARAGRALTENPYTIARGTAAGDMLAGAWVSGYLAHATSTGRPSVG